MCLVDSIVPQDNRLDAIVIAFSFKDRWSAQVATLLSIASLFSKIHTCAYDISHYFTSMLGFQNAIAGCSSTSVSALTCHVGATGTQLSTKPARRSL